MSLKPLLNYALESEELSSLGEGLRRKRQRAFVSASMRPYLLASVLEAAYGAAERPAVVVTGDDLEARDLTLDLRAFLSPRPVRYYPSRGVTYESHLAPPPHLVGLRIGALDLLDEWSGKAEPPVVVISAPALSEKVPSPKLRPHGMMLEVGAELDLDAAVGRLVASGYERVDQVDERGQFAVRGGILDLYPATEERAVRCELFGDEVDRLSWFSTFTQRTLAEAERVEVAPASELDPGLRELAELAKLEEADGGRRPDIADVLPLEDFCGLESLLPGDAFFVVAVEEGIAPSLSDNWQDVSAVLDPDEARRLYMEPGEVRKLIEERAALSLSAVSQDQPYEFRAQQAEPVARSLNKAEPELEKLIRSGYRTVVAWSRRSEAERATYNLARLRADELGADAPAKPGLVFTTASLSEGFVAPQFKLALIPEQRLLRKRRAVQAPRGREFLATYSDLNVGDFVTHLDHGIAKLEGFETRTVANVTRDYLFLEFRDGDSVHVPFDQMSKVSRYMTVDGADPLLSKLGGKRWERAKARARKVAQELAGELINLYAERSARSGNAFEPDSAWQLDFERAFPYRETDDQMDAIEEVKADMESERTMDRLVCGDVGYGKTEVALRAAFKCAVDGKQVMMLVPTTVLAQQHFGTFRERFQDFPVNVDLVSRFRSSGENRAVLRQFSEGRVDVLIGTHRMLSRDVVPKDLGLLIVDEEQRFGVKQKELLRQLKLRVDVLTMTATPIPRTLRMSIEGLRGISVIESPPEGRKPVKTYVGAYDEELVKRALEREFERGGQTFYMHNRVETIEEVAERLRALCPDIKFSVAHGQMDEKALEEAMFDFLRGGADCLVCTSIVESGLDIPQANTLIVERADLLGLAQLYQIRGRVGRSRTSAYAYLLYRSAAELSPEASARLATLSDYTELGSGFRIAMRDLEIRGAGNLLGDEQSGHVAAVGFELYCDMLDQAIREKSAAGATDDGQRPEPVRLDVAVDAYLPPEYVPYEAAKVDIHRRIAGSSEMAELRRLQEEIRDRFGPMPLPVRNLLQLQEVRLKLGIAGARTVTFRGGRLAVAPLELDSSQVSVLREREPQCIYKSGERTVSLRVTEDPDERFSAVVQAADAILAASLDS